MYFTNDQGLAGSSTLCLPMTLDFGSTHGWPVRQIWIFSSDPFIRKGREQTQISLNLTPKPLSPDYLKTPQNSGKHWGLAYGSSPGQPVKKKSLEWRPSCPVENVQCTHTPTCLSVGSAAPSLPLTRAGKRHLQRPLLSVSLQFRKLTPCKEQNSSSSCQISKRMPLFNAIIYTRAHVTTNIMMTTESSNVAYPHY